MKYILDRGFNKNYLLFANLVNIYIKTVFKNKMNQNKKIKNKNIITIRPQ